MGTLSWSLLGTLMPPPSMLLMSCPTVDEVSRSRHAAMDRSSLPVRAHVLTGARAQRNAQNAAGRWERTRTPALGAAQVIGTSWLNGASVAAGGSPETRGLSIGLVPRLRRHRAEGGGIPAPPSWEAMEYPHQSFGGSERRKRLLDLARSWCARVPPPLSYGRVSHARSSRYTPVSWFLIEKSAHLALQLFRRTITQHGEASPRFPKPVAHVDQK